MQNAWSCFTKTCLPLQREAFFEKMWLERVCWTRKAQMEAQIEHEIHPQEEPFPLARQFILFFESHRAGHREILVPKVESFRYLWWATKGIFQTIPWKQHSQPCSAFAPEAHFHKKHKNVWKCNCYKQLSIWINVSALFILHAEFDVHGFEPNFIEKKRFIKFWKFSEISSFGKSTEN